MRGSADSEQRHDRAVVWQAVESTGADYGNAMQERRVDPLLRREAQIGSAERIERDRHPARGRAGQRGEHVGRDSERNQEAPADRQHPFAHHCKRGQHGDDRTEPHQAGNGDSRQHRGIAPASMLARSDGSRARLTRTSVKIAAASATATDHTPITADKEVAPQRSSPRNEKSRRGRTNSDIRKFTLTTIAKAGQRDR